MTSTMTHGGAAAATQYLNTQVRSSQPLELVVMLYDAALRFTTAAREATVRRDLVARKTAMSKALATVDQLQNTLDMDRGGELAQELDRLYDWVRSRLLDAIVTRDIAPLDEARRILEILRSGWSEIARNPRAEPHP